VEAKIISAPADFAHSAITSPGIPSLSPKAITFFPKSIHNSSFLFLILYY
jgi:hypothetical protein